MRSFDQTTGANQHSPFAHYSEDLQSAISSFDPTTGSNGNSPFAHAERAPEEANDEGSQPGATATPETNSLEQRSSLRIGAHRGEPRGSVRVRRRRSEWGGMRKRLPVGAVPASTEGVPLRAGAVVRGLSLEPGMAGRESALAESGPSDAAGRSSARGIARDGEGRWSVPELRSSWDEFVRSRLHPDDAAEELTVEAAGGSGFETGTGYGWMRPSHYPNPDGTMWGEMLADPNYWEVWAVSHDPTTGPDGNHPYAQPCACVVGAGPGRICRVATSGDWAICGRCRPTEESPPGDCQCECDACCIPRHVVQEGMMQIGRAHV